MLICLFLIFLVFFVLFFDFFIVFVLVVSAGLLLLVCSRAEGHDRPVRGPEGPAGGPVWGAAWCWWQPPTYSELGVEKRRRLPLEGGDQPHLAGLEGPHKFRRHLQEAGRSSPPLLSLRHEVYQPKIFGW